MADDASGDGADDRDGRDGRSDRTTDVTTTDWQEDREMRVDETTSRPDVEDAVTDDSVGPDGSNEPDAVDRIPLDLSGANDERGAADDERDRPEDEYGPEPSSAPIEAGDPSLEHAVFVLLGAIAMVLVIVRLLALPLG